eukprot:TRINITY_DN20557_c1_g3_i1.p1 TRINITY_DN20557_c1_g3~~TRINITY_DN20557_c1_g3_i1.p1  ORF type:complete len:504 (-),score=61.99 TRINITY_DN20557_c1_g3_i1:47-1558(-)
MLFSRATAFVATFATTDATTLRAAGEAAGILIGSQFKYDSIFNSSTPLADNMYRTVHSEQFALSTVGNQCKWGSTHRVQGTYSLDKCIDSFKYAINAEQKFRGHNLCWGNDNPSWLENGNFSAGELREILQEHVRHVMQGVKQAAGQSPLAWDVVNEASDNEHPLKNNFWYPKVPDYIDVAFIAAREADPDTLLFYNDFNSEATGKGHSDSVYALVKDMAARGVPIDGVGIQMHVQVENPPDVGAVATNIDRIGALGLQVHITEMDVKCAEPCTEARLKIQEDIYASMLRVCLERKSVCTSFETWGFTDGISWLNGQRCKPTAGPCHALPFDEDYRPKGAVQAMLDVLAGKPSRSYQQLTAACQNAKPLGGLHTVSSIEDCQTLCDVTEHCTAVDTNGQKCYLKSRCEGSFGSCSGWCAYRVQTRPYESLTKGCDTKTALGTLHNVASIEECEYLCDTTPTCVATYGNASSCYLKSRCEGGTVGPCVGWCARRVVAFVGATFV